MQANGFLPKHWKTSGDTVDGSEILLSPAEVGSENPIIYKVLFTFQVVVWDF